MLAPRCPCTALSAMVIKVTTSGVISRARVIVCALRSGTAESNCNTNESAPACAVVLHRDVTDMQHVCEVDHKQAAL